MNNMAVGLIAGLLLAIASVADGIVGFVVGVVLGGIGLVIGAHRDGVIDLGAVLRSRGRG